MDRTVRVKICGITSAEDAAAAIELGADALGFNFHKKSPRYIEPSKVKVLIEKLPPMVSMVGVFVDEFSPERVVSIAHAVGLGTVQLHGSESPEYVKKVSGVRVFKAFRVGDEFDPGKIKAYSVNAFLLDTYAPDQHGGTGKTFDWRVAVVAKEQGRLILAGGLNPENVYDAICTVKPFAIDVCSGVEKKAGRKDHQKMEALFKEVHRARLDLWNESDD